MAYLFERFPSFGQTFCLREVAELERQGWDVRIFSIRRPNEELVHHGSGDLARRVHYLPDETALLDDVNKRSAARELPAEAIEAIREWGRRPDFLRLQQAAYVGMQLRCAGIHHVHAHFAGMAARTAFWIRRFFGTAYSFTAHANDIFVPTRFEIGLEQLVESAAAVVTVSDYSVAWLRERFPQQGKKLRRIYNGIDPSQFAQRGMASVVPLILSIGRLIEKKGFADLIAACALLKNRGWKFRCEIVGDGPLADDLQKQIDASRLQSVVQLIGPRTQPEIAESLARASAFVLPCVADAQGGMDNLPTVIMEAMAAGVPVVSTRLAGIPEMIDENITGRLVSPHAPDALAGALEELLQEPELAETMGEQGRVRAAERFSVEKNVSELASLFSRVLGS
ncbi:MAG: glycosyltransferase family 4 protein [Chthoniobacterales bacterium]